MKEHSVETLRAFNRSYTRRIGALDDNFLGQPRPLGPSRALWEIGIDGLSVSHLRGRLALDSGYLSRLLRGLEDEGLITTEQDPNDGRRRTVKLTKTGHIEWAILDQRSEQLAANIVEQLSSRHQEELATALATANRLLCAATISFQVVDPRSADAISSMTAYFDELDARFPAGFDPGDTLVADAPAMDAPHGAFVVAYSDNEPVACGGVLGIEDGIGEIKRMWVHDNWRGLGIGRRFLSELEDRSRSIGHHTIRLDTNSALVEAITMYESSGYQNIERYNDNPFAKRWFEKTF